MAAFLALLMSPPLVADDHIVDFDDTVDFSGIKTFTLRDGTSTSRRPELSDPLFLRNLKQAIAAELVERGLEDAGSSAPDVYVSFSVESQEFVFGSGGRANPVGAPGAGPGRGGRMGRGGDLMSLGAVDFSDAGLVVDLLAAKQAGLLIWRGVYRDTERDVSKLVDNLPSNARKLLAEFPPKGRRR